MASPVASARSSTDVAETEGGEWPPFDRAGAWPQTQAYLHLIAQMLGKLQLALAPTLPQWAHTPLAGVSSAEWSAKLGEWVLPYETVRRDPNRTQTIRTFMDAVYRAAGELAGWDLEAFKYVRPPGREKPDTRTDE